MLTILQMLSLLPPSPSLGLEFQSGAGLLFIAAVYLSRELSFHVQDVTRSCPDERENLGRRGLIERNSLSLFLPPEVSGVNEKKITIKNLESVKIVWEDIDNTTKILCDVKCTNTGRCSTIHCVTSEFFLVQV